MKWKVSDFFGDREKPSISDEGSLENDQSNNSGKLAFDSIKMEKLIPNSELLVVKSAHHFEIATRKKYIKVLVDNIFQFIES